MRDTFDIRHFNHGIISSVDMEDIPPESASDSSNVDGDVGEGILKGIPTDVTYLTNGDTALLNAGLGELIEDNGVYYLVYFDKNGSVIKVVKNFQSSTVADRRVDTLLSSVTEATMVVNNKEVHVGIGNGSTSYPRWIGKVLTGQFKHTDYTSFFEGSGLDDLTGTITGYTGVKLVTFDVEIDGEGTPDTFKWRKDGGAYTETVNITGSAQALSDGVTITFAATTGHASGDIWHITTGGLYVTLAEPVFSPAITIGAVATAGTGAKYFDTANTYQWALSFIYDGYQESPISYNSITDVAGADSEYFTLTLTAADMNINPASFNRRITGINIYRADYVTTTTARNRGLFRLVASADINDAGWTAATDDMTLTVVDYGVTAKVGSGSILNYGAVTYTENSGMGEENIEWSMGYGLSTKGSGYHFIGDAYHPQIPDADRYIFRSKSLRYDMFDWTSDFVIMPEKITALEFYEGKLYAFSLNKVFRVNPDGLYIEDVFEGAGAQSKRSVHSTDQGMFFANSLNAWMYNGQIIPIGDAIRQGTTSWQTFAYGALTDIVVTSDSKKGYVLFINDYLYATEPSNIYNVLCWAFSPSKNRWDRWLFGGYVANAYTGVVKGKDGEVYLSNGIGTYKLMRNTSTQAWTWTSQELSFNETRQKKSFASIKVDKGGTVALYYGLDGIAVASFTSYTNEALINLYGKTIRVYMSASSGANTVDSLEIVFRRLRGAR